MNILVIGSGGREHSLAWKAAQSTSAEKVFVAPGNAGTALEKNLQNVDIDPMNFEALAEFASNNNIGLTIVGPEAPLVDGIVDFFTAKGLPCFGPSAKAAQLEGSKSFSKDFLSRHNIPTAAYKSFTDVGPAIDYIKTNGAPIVVKADGLAAGKGVIVASTEAEAIAAVEDMLADNKFGEAGNRVVIEEFLEGEEASFIAIVDGCNVLPMATSQDHKARDDGDLGPNTGGMGAYSPAPVVSAEIHQKIMDQVIIPTVKGMAADGNDYKGFLYAGLMITPTGEIAVVEFNCRFGDPEAQPVMMRLNSDLCELCLAAITGTLDSKTVEWDPRSAVGIVMAAGGYPNSYDKGDVIEGLADTGSKDSKIFHAGTVESKGTVVTNGGRVLCAVALGETVSSAQICAYELVNTVSWKDIYFRKDIAYRAIARENA